LTSFGSDLLVAPNPIDFDSVFSNFGSLAENVAVLALISTILGGYIIGVIWARRADKRCFIGIYLHCKCKFPFHTIPYHTIPYHTIPHLPHHTKLYHTTPYYIYHIIPYHTTPYTIPHHAIKYHILSYHIILYHTIPSPIFTFYSQTVYEDYTRSSAQQAMTSSVISPEYFELMENYGKVDIVFLDLWRTVQKMILTGPLGRTELSSINKVSGG
jgi:hypothetical protein